MKKMWILSILLCCLLLSTSVFAYNPIGGKFSRGVSNTCYYVDSTASAYTTRINAAANNWVNTGHGWNPIYMTPVSSSYLTHMDFYGKTTSFWGDSNIRGETRMFTNSGQDITSKAHEMGHAFGLDHVSNVNALMHRYSNERLTHVVSLDEHNGINALY